MFETTGAVRDQCRLAIHQKPTDAKAMDSFELNKILGALLGTCTFLVALNIAADAIFAPEVPVQHGYEIALQEPPTTETTVERAPEQKPIQERVASATVEQGKEATKKCAACHTFEPGGPNRVGPNLWDIVGRPRASAEGFNYSAVMRAKGGTWTLPELDTFLANPRGYIPGTSMSFAGISRPRERADIIAYLRTRSDNPVALPQNQSAEQGQSKDQGSAP